MIHKVLPVVRLTLAYFNAIAAFTFPYIYAGWLYHAVQAVHLDFSVFRNDTLSTGWDLQWFQEISFSLCVTMDCIVIGVNLLGDDG